MRALGIDVGARRIGLALSDPSGTLASPWQTVHRQAGDDEFALLRPLVDHLRADPDGLEVIVIGLPRHLDGREHAGAEPVRQLARRLEVEARVPVVLQDERLTSREAESRLAERERDWRKRKSKLDAAAAAIILQEYLDTRPRAAAFSDA